MRHLFAALIVLAAGYAFAADTCDLCKNTYHEDRTITPECVQVAPGTEGRVGCFIDPMHLDPNGNWFCEFKGTACTTYDPTCTDANGNGICDRDDDIGDCGPNEPPDLCASPILIANEGARYALPHVVSFDIDADGIMDRVPWPSPDVAWLALDQNGNGRIDDGSELVGDSTSPSARHGFEYLRMWDDVPENGTLDVFDAGWSRFLLWHDLNSDGVSQDGELSRLADSNITAIAWAYTHTGRRDPNGNMLRLKGQAWRGNQVVPIYDVWLRKR